MDSGIAQGFLFYSGGTAWDFHPLPSSLTISKQMIKPVIYIYINFNNYIL